METDLTIVMQRRTVVAGWFGVGADAVALRSDPPASIPGGDQAWVVWLPNASGGVTSMDVITEAGLPKMITGPVPVPTAQVSARWKHEAPVTSSLPTEDRTAGEMACFTVGVMLGLPAISEKYVKVLEIRRLGQNDDAPSRAYSVTLRMEMPPWSELGTIRMTVQPETRDVWDMVFQVGR